MIVHSDKIIGEMIEYADRFRRDLMPDLFLVSDFIRGLDRNKDEIKKILDALDQSKSGVITIRKELDL